jgi:hypothetical protein
LICNAKITRKDYFNCCILFFIFHTFNTSPACIQKYIQNVCVLSVQVLLQYQDRSSWWINYPQSCGFRLNLKLFYTTVDQSDIKYIYTFDPFAPILYRAMVLFSTNINCCR